MRIWLCAGQFPYSHPRLRAQTSRVEVGVWFCRRCVPCAARCRPFEKACLMSSLFEPVLPPASLWQEATLSGQPPNHIVESPAWPDLREPAPHGTTRSAARTRLPINRIDPDPRNPRPPIFQELYDLVRSLTTSGLLQPIVMRP